MGAHEFEQLERDFHELAAMRDHESLERVARVMALAGRLVRRSLAQLSSRNVPTPSWAYEAPTWEDIACDSRGDSVDIVIPTYCTYWWEWVRHATVCSEDALIERVSAPLLRDRDWPPMEFLIRTQVCAETAVDETPTFGKSRTAQLWREIARASVGACRFFASVMNRSPAREKATRTIPTLSRIEMRCLPRLRELGAVSLAARKPASAVAAAFGAVATETYVKKPLARLVQLRLLKSKTGRNGGYWLTTLGLRLASSHQMKPRKRD